MSFPFAILRKTVTESTMDDAAAAVGDGYGHGTVCLAERQNAGRGRLPGRRWENGDSALLFSVILKKDSLRMSCPPTQTMALALCRHLEKAYSLSPQIKWPNDVLLSGRKVAGILVETMGNFFLVGMGLNLVLGGGIKEFRSPAAGLSDYIGRKAEAGVELRGILDELLHLIRQPASIRELKCRLACMNRNVSVLVGHPSKKDVRHGRIAGLNEDGALLLDRGNGDFFPVYSGEVDFS